MPTVNDVLRMAAEALNVAFDYFDIPKVWLPPSSDRAAGQIIYRDSLHSLYWRWGDRLGHCHPSPGSLSWTDFPEDVPQIIPAVTFSLRDYAERTIRRERGVHVVEACGLAPGAAACKPPKGGLAWACLATRDDVDAAAWAVAAFVAGRLGVQARLPRPLATSNEPGVGRVTDSLLAAGRSARREGRDLSWNYLGRAGIGDELDGDGLLLGRPPRLGKPTLEELAAHLRVNAGPPPRFEALALLAGAAREAAGVEEAHPGEVTAWLPGGAAEVLGLAKRIEAGEPAPPVRTRLYEDVDFFISHHVVEENHAAALALGLLGRPVPCLVTSRAEIRPTGFALAEQAGAWRLEGPGGERPISEAMARAIEDLGVHPYSPGPYSPPPPEAG